MEHWVLLPLLVEVQFNVWPSIQSSSHVMEEFPIWVETYIVCENLQIDEIYLWWKFCHQCPLSCSHPIFTFAQTNWVWKYKMIKFCKFQILSLPLLDTPCHQAPRVQSWLLGVCPPAEAEADQLLSRVRRGPWGSHCRGTGGARWW